MIAGVDVQTLMQAAATATGTLFILGNQVGDRPPYPFFRYNVTSDNIEQPYMNSKSNAEKGGDDTTIVRTRTEKFSGVVSITGVDENNSNTIRTLIGEVYDWFNEEAAEELMEGMGIVARMVGQITDRTTLIEPFYEFQMGFDVRLDGAESKTSEIEAVKTVTLGNTVNDVAQDDLIISI